MLRLTIVSGPDIGRTFDLHPGKSLVVGRGMKSDTRINDSSVSRIHFEITPEIDSATVTDLGSSSGTFVENDKVQSHSIRIGETVRAGDSRLQLIRCDDAEQTIAAQ